VEKVALFSAASVGLDGICLVVSPLIALMKEYNVDWLWKAKKGIKAAAIYFMGMASRESIEFWIIRIYWGL